MSSGNQTAKRKWWQFGRKKIGGIVLALIISLIASGLYYFLQEHEESVAQSQKAQLDRDQKAKYVAVIMTEGSRSFSIPQEFRNGFGLNRFAVGLGLQR